MAVRFDADGEDYTRALAMGTLGSISVVCWFKVSVDRNTWSTPWFIDNGVGDNWGIQTSNDGVTMGVVDGGTTLQNMGAVTVGAWYFSCLVMSGATGTLYHATGSASSLSTVAISGGTSDVNAATLRIGESPWGGEWLNGCVAGFKFWSAALTAAEAANEWRQYVPHRTANLALWAPLIVPETTDYSGNARTLTGGAGATREDGPPIPWQATRPRFVLPTGVAVTPQSGSDSGTLSETAQLVRISSVTDTAQVTETGSGSAAATATDTAALTDTSAMLHGYADTDSATLTDAGTGAAASTGSDQATLIDAATVGAAATSADTATVGDTTALTATLTAPDTATVTDSAVLDAGSGDKTGGDSAALADTATVSAAVAASDAGSHTETATVDASPAVTDTASLAEAVTVLVIISAGDTATTSDQHGTTGSLTAVDAAVLGDSASLVALTAAADAAALAELASAVDLSNQHDITLSAELGARRWSASLGAERRHSAGLPARRWTASLEAQP